MKYKNIQLKSVASAVVLAFLFASSFVVAPASASTTQITGGTYGPNCNSGGYFTPGSVTIDSGSTVTISVPSNDPYSGGVQVHGFPEGNFTVLPGASHTTSALTSDVSYYGTWPNTGCMKGTGSITVSAPAPSPSPSPSPAPAPKSSSGSTKQSTGSSSKSSSSTPSSTNSNDATKTNDKSSIEKSAATTSTTAPTSDNASASSGAPTHSSTSTNPSETTTNSKPMTSTTAFKLVGATSALVAVIVAAGLIWQFALHRSLPWHK